jgi:glycosyltransferase involved in cell wall biosynthesis
MKTIYVYPIFGTSPYYQEIINYPPQSVSFSQKTLDEYKSTGLNTSFRNLARRLLSTFKLPRLTYVPKTSSDLIHSSRGILILNRKPWVVDIENVGSIVNFRYDLLNSQFQRKLILKLLFSRFCRRILAWSLASKKSILNGLDRKLEEKIEIVYPAMHVPQIKRKEDEKIRLLFIGDFYRKGGLDVLESFKVLNSKYDISLTMITNVPYKFRKIFDSFKNINFTEPKLPRNVLYQNYYPNCDIYLYPTYWDTFGLTILEAMSFSIPVITTKMYATPEMIIDGKNGFLLNSPLLWHNESYLPTYKDWNGFYRKVKTPHKEIINQLVEKTSLLIEDSSLRRKMGRYGRKLVEKGKFSIKERNKKLKRIYEEAIS